MEGKTITIPIERFEQLVRSEQDARFLKSYIKSKKDNLRIIDTDDLRMLCEIYIGGDDQ